MKKLVLLITSCVCVLTMFFGGVLNVKAATGLKLPNGGQISNTGVAAAYGKSSGGEDGYANLQCAIECKNGTILRDSATAVIESDVSSSLTLYTSMSVYYTTTDGSQLTTTNFPSETQIPTGGCSKTLNAPNLYGK